MKVSMATAWRLAIWAIWFMASLALIETGFNLHPKLYGLLIGTLGTVSLLSSWWWILRAWYKEKG